MFTVKPRWDLALLIRSRASFHLPKTHHFFCRRRSYSVPGQHQARDAGAVTVEQQHADHCRGHAQCRLLRATPAPSQRRNRPAQRTPPPAMPGTNSGKHGDDQARCGAVATGQPGLNRHQHAQRGRHTLAARSAENRDSARLRHQRQAGGGECPGPATRPARFTLRRRPARSARRSCCRCAAHWWRPADPCCEGPSPSAC